MTVVSNRYLARRPYRRTSILRLSMACVLALTSTLPLASHAEAKGPRSPIHGIPKYTPMLASDTLNNS